MGTPCFPPRTQQLTAKRESINRLEGHSTGMTSCGAQDGNTSRLL